MARPFTMREHDGIAWSELNPRTSMQQVIELNSTLSDLYAIARGAARAKVFDTLAELDAWLAIPANTATLQIGDNLLIRQQSVPDFWWDGTVKQPLETEKVIIALATALQDGLMSKNDYTKLYEIEDRATRVTAPSDIGAATAAQGALAASAYQKPANGIPKTDLASAVQTSIGKADTALQSVPDATTSTKGVALLGAASGAARYGQKADVGLGNVDNTADSIKSVASAAKLTTPRKINGVSFDGSADITLTAGDLSVTVITVGVTAPPTSKVGDLWFDTSGN